MIRGFLETLILLIFFLGQPVAPDTAQSPPNSTGDSFFSTVEAHSDGPNIADPVSEACSSCWPLTGARSLPWRPRLCFKQFSHNRSENTR